MSEYEFYELVLMSSNTLVALVTLFFSIFAAYIVCIYLVGAKLSRYQWLGISFVCSVFSVFLIRLILGALFLESDIYDSYYGTTLDSIPAGWIIGPGTLAVSWLLSVIYSIQVRLSR